jgi:PAS domain S-box-containing protein
MATGKPAEVEVEGVNNDGSHYHARVQAFPVFGENGTGIGFIEVAEDITERKQIEETLKQSEERYRALVENVNLGINLIDAAHNIIMVNAGQSSHFGKNRSETIGKKCYQEFEKRDAVCPHCPGVQTMASGQPAEAETEGIRDDGSRFNVRLQTFPIFGQDGPVTSFIEVVEDITERKQMEETLQRAYDELKTSETRYRTLVDNVDLGINLIDVNHTIVMVNAAESKHFNKPVSDFIGKKCFREFEKRDAVCPHCPGVQAMATGQSAEIETEGVENDGRPYTARIQAFPIFGHDGHVAGFIEITENITERKRAEENLRESEERFRLLVEHSKAP